MFFLKILLLLPLLSFCANPTIENREGIFDPNFTQVTITKSTPPLPVTIDLAFLPNLFSIPADTSGNNYMVSFSIKKSNFGSPMYYEHLNVFISLSNMGTINEPIFYHTGTLIKNCASPCSALFTNIQNTDGEDLTDTHKRHLITKSPLDHFFHLIVKVHPSHIGEEWEAIHGFSGINTGISQILYPFYRIKIYIGR